MLVTIHLEPFDGTISLDHYGFDPCEFQGLYWDQLRGNYEHTVFSISKNQYLLTTCVSNISKANLKSYCHNIETNVSVFSPYKNLPK